MNHANALRGTFMGRRVKTEGEALEEIALSIEHEVPVVGEAGVFMDPVDPSKICDVFSFSKFYEDSQGLVLEDLQVPEGMWKRILLSDKGYMSGCQADSWDWTKYSHGGGEFEDGHFKTFTHARAQPIRQVPAKVLYWFMRAVYSVREDPNYDLVLGAFLRFFSAPVLTGDRVDKDLLLPEEPRLKVCSYGWPLNHPLGHTKSLPYVRHGSYPIITGSPTQTLLYAILGDSNMERINAVHSWIVGSTIPAVFNTEALAKDKNCAVLFNRNTSNVIHLVPSTERNASLGCQADSEWFIPRKVNT